MVHRREINGAPALFGNQGDLFGNAMTWWDHETGSVWSQPRGEAILGPLTGTRLELLPSTLATWADWRSAHPDTLALDVPGWATGFHLDDMAIVVDRGAETAAYRIPDVRKERVVNDTVGGIEVAIVIDPATPERWAVFSRRIDDRVLDLELIPAGLRDRATGSLFDPFVGRGRSGPLRDQSLDRIPAFTSFPEDYWTFFPTGSMWPDEAAAPG